VVCADSAERCSKRSIYLERYEQSMQWERYRLTAEQKAANAEADGAQSRFSHLAAALTMLTVAGFLFGFSLTPQGQERRALFLGCATCFAIAGVGWSAYHTMEQYTRPPAASARSFANGEVALEHEQFGAAVSELTRATRLWPGFSAAYSDLAIAQYEVSRPSGKEAETPSIDALTKAVADDRRAIETGSESPTVSFDLGADLLYLGLETNSNREIRQARRLSSDAARRFNVQRNQGRYPGGYLISARFTVAEADLALGLASARDYCAAVATMLQLKREMSPEAVEQAAGADIKLIVRERPWRRGVARSLLAHVKAAAQGDSGALCTAPPGSHKGPSSPQVAAAASLVSWFRVH
jgi:hypothetical protein